MVLNFAGARRDSFLSLLTLNEIKHPSLPSGEHHSDNQFKADENASSNEQRHYVAVILSDAKNP
jgi:hypothetical protein